MILLFVESGVFSLYFFRFCVSIASVSDNLREGGLQDGYERGSSNHQSTGLYLLSGDIWRIVRCGDFYGTVFWKEGFFLVKKGVWLQNIVNFER